MNFSIMASMVISIGLVVMFLCSHAAIALSDESIITAQSPASSMSDESSIVSESPASSMDSYIVYTESWKKPPQFASLKLWYQHMLDSLPTRSANLKPRLVYVYKYAITGFSAYLTSEKANALSKLPGVLAVVKDQNHVLHH